PRGVGVPGYMVRLILSGRQGAFALGPSPHAGRNTLFQQLHNGKKMKIAFIGQPNCGKSTIFNYFSGYKAAVSNFPGTTVKYTISQVVFQGEAITCVDLPGVYSLTSTDQAELESRNYLLSGEADVIINVIDASLLGRSLELT